MKHTILLLLLISCTTTIPPNAQPPMITPPPLPDLDSQFDNTPKIQIEAQQYGFLPNEINLKQGEKARLVITSDGDYNFTLPEFNIDEELERGEDVKIDITPNKKGTFIFYSEREGKDIEGKLIVK